MSLRKVYPAVIKAATPSFNSEGAGDFLFFPMLIRDLDRSPKGSLPIINRSVRDIYYIFA